MGQDGLQVPRPTQVKLAGTNQHPPALMDEGAAFTGSLRGPNPIKGEVTGTAE